MRLPSTTPQPAAAKAGSICSARVSASFILKTSRSPTPKKQAEARSEAPRRRSTLPAKLPAQRSTPLAITTGSHFAGASGLFVMNMWTAGRFALFFHDIPYGSFHARVVVEPASAASLGPPFLAEQSRRRQQSIASLSFRVHHVLSWFITSAGWYPAAVTTT